LSAGGGYFVPRRIHLSLFLFLLAIAGRESILSFLLKARMGEFPGAEDGGKCNSGEDDHL